MESQLQPPSHGRPRYEEDPHGVGLHSVVEGEGEHNHHGEKKSVLKKVKDKAKKIKHTITKHEHGHEQEYRHDQISEDEDEDEEIGNDPGVHGAPMYESTVIRGTNLPKQTDLTLEKPTETPENRHFPDVRTPHVGDEQNRPSHPPAMEHELGRPPPEIRQSESWKPLEVSQNATRTEEANERVPKIGPLVALEEDPHSPNNTPQGIPPSNYQAKAFDPTCEGGKEIDVGPLVKRFDDMKVGDEPELKPVPESHMYAGSHDQSGHEQKLKPVSESLLYPGSRDQFGHESKLKPLLEPQLPTGSRDQFAHESKLKPMPEPQLPTGSRDQFGHETKLKPVLEPQLPTGSHDQLGHELKLKTAPESQLYTGSHDQFAPQGIPPQELFKPDSKPGDRSTETVSERSNPDRPDTMPADTTVGKISSAAHMIADKASAAKNLVASKLGYGDQGHSDSLTSESATEHAHEDATATGTDKGVSVKEYLVEKLRPGEEDKALSEVITEAFNKKTEGTQGTKEVPLTGRVTESEEVAARLGTGKENKREGEDAVAAGTESSGTGVVSRLKDAVGSWLGKSAGMETAKNSVGQSYVSDVGSAGRGEDINSQQRRLQESGN